MSNAIANTSKDIDPNILLGDLMFYTLSDLRISSDDLRNLFLKNNLNEKFVRNISKADAFRRATSSVTETVNINYLGAYVRAKIEVDEISNTKDGIVKIIGRKVLDKKNKTVNYETVGTFKFNRSMDTFESALSPNIDLSEFPYSTKLDLAAKNYSDWSEFHTKDTIRNIVNNILKTFHPTPLLNSGLCKFVPKTSRDSLFALQSIIRDLDGSCIVPGDENQFEVIPVIDTEEQRKLIKKNVTKDVTTDLNDMATELAVILKEKKALPVKTINAYIRKYNDLKKKTGVYENLVGSYASVINKQIQQAIKFVESNK